MESELFITITHFINPHLFWFKTTESDDAGHVHVLKYLEQSLEQLYKNKPLCDNQLRPQIGDKVAVNFIAWNKYIRAEILQKAEFQQEEYIVWAIDYGFPLLTKKEYLRHLPTNLRNDISRIQMGGISCVYPAEQEFDDEEGNLVLVKKDKWLQKTCNMLEKLLMDAISISFVKYYENSVNHQNWGDLIVTNHRGNEINALNYLLKTNNAIEEKNLSVFQENCAKLNTTKIAPWLSNDRNTKMKLNTIKHNYVEHSKQMAAALIDEQAKRKVEDWQKRNEIKAIDEFSEIPEVVCTVENSQYVDEVTFDDSVSVVLEKNYIGKAGAITKSKRCTNIDISESVLADAFQMDDMLTKADINLIAQPSESLLSTSTTTSVRLQKLAELRRTTARNKYKDKLVMPSENIPKQMHAVLPLSKESTSNSVVSGNSTRCQKLLEMRKKTARAEKQHNKTVETNKSESDVIGRSADIDSSQNLNNMQCVNTTKNSTKTLDNFSYTLLEQSTTSSTVDAISKTQENKSEKSVDNARTKRLIALRKKLDSSSVISNSSENKGSTEKGKVQQEKIVTKGKDILIPLDKMNFELKPKTFSKVEDNINDLKDMCISEATSFGPKKSIKEKLKNDQSCYDNLTIIPAGYDLTRLQTYKNEENHWHRKKTTLYDSVAHDSSTTKVKLQLSNDTNDRSYSSSDSFETELREKPTRTQNSLLQNKNAKDSGRCTEQYEPSNTSFINKRDIGMDVISTQMSTSSNSTMLNEKIYKRRKLKSPTSQLSKINHIIEQHNIERVLGNSNILNLKQLNTSSSSQSLIHSLSSNDSSSEINCIRGHLKNITTCNSSSSTSENKVQTEKLLKDVCNYEALTEVKYTDSFPIVEGERKVQTKFIDHLVLAHGSIQLMPVENISDISFLPEIHEEMRQMRANKVLRVQVYSWSHVLRNNSLFVVNPSKSGKTWAYLPPLCSLLCCRKALTTSTFGPMALILVASLKHVELINNYCRRLMSGLKADAPTCIPSYGMRNFIETKVQLLNGCGVLVATPSSVLRLLQDNMDEPLFNPERLQHIVIDDMDIMMSRAQQDFENALSTLFKIAKRNKHKKLTPQLIVTSRDWDSIMVKLIQKSNQPLLLIGDFLEAAVYGQAKISIKLQSSEKKNEVVHKFIKKITMSAQCLNNRTLIICNDDDDVQNIMKFLQECGYPCLGYYNRSTDIERVTVEEWKRKVSSQILVCTDTRFCELQIQNVNNLIHYSMPTSWTRFTTRFSALARTYKNYVSRNFEEILLSTTSNEHYAHSMILLDENNNMQLPRLVDFMIKHNQIVQEEIVAVSKRVMTTIEEQKILNGCQLCPQLLEFGECDESRCDNRHELTRFDVQDKNDDIPCAGEIRIHLLKVFSPTHYAVRLLRHKVPNDTKWLEVRRSSEALTFAVQLDMHYRNEKNVTLHWPPHVNDMCIYLYGDNFRRGRILEAPVFDQKNTNVVQSNLKVTLKLIDDGPIISSVKCNEIFVCDDKFKNFPAQAVDVRLMNIVPFDNERSWDSRTTKQVQKWLMEDINSDNVIQASIDFSLANTIWVKNIVVMQKLAGIDAYCQIVHLKKSLVEKSFGVIYKGDRKHIRELADAAGLLNSVQEVKVDNEDSDFDYESCKSDSINLIKFSSSNDSSMASANHESDFEQNMNRSNTEHKSNTAKVLNNDGKDWDDNENLRNFNEALVPISLNQIPKTSDLAKNNFSYTVPEKTVVMPSKPESWSQLPLNEIIKVEIGDERENGNWENIFLQITDKNFMFVFEELNKLISEHIDTIKLSKTKQKEIYEFNNLQNCLVKYDNRYLRAKVYGVYGEGEERLYRFFLCDYACFTNVKYEDLYRDCLYETTKEITNFTPYQAVHCTLAGIKWNSFTTKYHVTKNYLYACAVLKSEIKETSSLNLPINSYKILLYECENENEFSSAVLFNKTLLDNGITVPDESTKTFLDYEIDYNKYEGFTKDIKQTEEEEINSSSELFTCEQLIKSIQSGAFEIEMDDIVDQMQMKDNKAIANSTEDTTMLENNEIKLSHSSQLNYNTDGERIERSKIPTSDSEVEEQGHCSSISNSIKSSTSLSSTEEEEISNCSSEPPIPPLKTLYKRPITTWYENDCMIFLSIHAPDIKEYFLEVTSKTLLFVALVQGETCVLHMNLLGYIVPQHVSHEIKGLNVIVRLTKLVFEKWPRLLNESTKYCWLKYNFNAFDSGDMNYVMPQQCLHTILDNELFCRSERKDEYNSDDDSERELYQTYNPILDNEDDCDPFSI